MAKADYTLTPQATLSVTLGLFNTAEDTVGPQADISYADATYAGGSHVATEIDAWLKYQLYSNASVLFWAAYAMTGDALDLVMDGTTYESQDVVGAGAQVAYTFSSNSCQVGPNGRRLPQPSAIVVSAPGNASRLTLSSTRNVSTIALNPASRPKGQGRLHD